MSVFALLALAACSTADTGTPTDTGDTADTAPVEDTRPIWTPYRIETSSSLNGIYASGKGVYVVGSGGFAWEGGASGWEFMDIEVGDEDLTDLWGQGQNDDTILAGSTSAGHVAQFTGTGGWTTGDLADTNIIWGVGGSGPSDLYAVGWGRAYVYDGVTWTYEALPDQSVKLNDVYAAGGEAFAIGEEGACVHRGNGGNWTECPTGVTVALNGISGSSANDVWAVGDAGTVLHFDGSAWTVETVPTTDTLSAVFVPEAGSVYAVGNNMAIIRLVDGAWELMRVPDDDVKNNLYAIHGISAQNVWASGNRGMVLQYKDAE